MFFGLVFAAPCGQMRSGIEVEVGETELILGNLGIACKTLRMNGEVKGDLLAGGMYLTTSDAVDGDVTFGGYNIKVLGTVGDDVRLVAANIEVSSTVMGDLVALGGNVRILGDIAGDVMVGGGNVWIQGNIQGSLEVQSGKIVIAGTIGQNAVVTTSRLIVSSTAVLNGSLSYTSNHEADIAEGAQIAGEIKRDPEGRAIGLWRVASALANYLPERPGSWEDWWNGFPLWFRILLRLSSFASLLITGIVILLIYERHANIVVDRIVSFPLKALIWGLIFLVGVPIAALILCVSVIGLPVGLIALITYLMFSYVSRVYVALAIGREILDRVTRQDVRVIWMLVLGLVIITALSSIPFYIGWVVRLICVLFGLGGMLMVGRRVHVVSRDEAT